MPNACTRCHADRPAQWAAKQVETWYGHQPRGFQRYAEALGATAAGVPGATNLLQAVVRDSDAGHRRASRSPVWDRRRFWGSATASARD